MIIKPKRLSPGDKLGVIALSTSASFLKEEFRQRAYTRIQELFDVSIVEAPNVHSLEGHTAGSVKERVKSLHDFFKRRDIHGIISFWGGFNSHQVLEFLDYDLIRSNPKILLGYSDSTSFLSAVQHKTGLVTFNGPAVITFAKPVLPSETEESVVSLLTRAEKTYTYPVSKSFTDNQWWTEDKMEFSPNPGLKIFKRGVAQGRIVGGNVGTLLLLAGTSYWPSMRGKILFIEDDEVENSKTIDRYFTQLRHMGVFDQIKGLVVGRFPRCVGFSEQDSLEMILRDALKGYSFPVITEFDMGHSDPILTIPIGAKVEIDANKRIVKLLENVVR